MEKVEPHYIAEARNDAARALKSRLIWRALRSRPEIIKSVQAELSTKNREVPYIDAWMEVLSDVDAVKQVLRGRRDRDYWLRISVPFTSRSTGIDFADVALRRRIREAARRLADKGFGYKRAAEQVFDVRADDGDTNSRGYR